MKTKVLTAVALVIVLATFPAWAKHRGPSVPIDPTLDPVSCGSGATFDPGSSDTAGKFTNDVTTADFSCKCILTIPGTTPRRCSAEREAFTDGTFAGIPIGCQTVIDTVNNVTTLVIGTTSCPGTNDYVFSYESSTY